MKKISIRTICCFVLFLWISLPVFALNPEEEITKLKDQLKNDIGTTSITQCQNTLVPVYDLELMEFLRFLEINFQNKSANSSLTDIAIARYSEFRTSIRESFNNLNPGIILSADVTGVNQDELNAYQVCARITDSYLDLAKNRMIQQIKNTGAQKRTTIMVEKYKAINTRLRELNSQIARMYGYFMTFKEKLPGFLQECVN